jgi:hypothetical protein
MNSNWWWNKRWIVRDEGKIGDVVACNGKYGEFWLEPNDSIDSSFFWVRSNDNGGGMDLCWQNSFVYSVGETTPSIAMLPSWEGTISQQVRDTYTAAAAEMRRIGRNPYTARLEGHICYKKVWEIVRFFCFQGVQENGRDWIVIDTRVQGIQTLEDGTAHGDPP